MGEQKNDGGPAFPCDGAFGDRGMSLRDYFAGQAMIALATNSEWELLDDTAQSNFAATAYGLADAMLAERGK